MKDITYIQAQIQSPLSITEFSILVNLSVAISGDARLRLITRFMQEQEGRRRRKKLIIMTVTKHYVLHHTKLTRLMIRFTC
jgi:hypothetical protein